jgi:hypothetical protein
MSHVPSSRPLSAGVRREAWLHVGAYTASLSFTFDGALLDAF